MTLAELVVAMTLAATILASASSVLLRQRRSAESHSARTRAELQVGAALGAASAMLTGLSSAAGDLATGQARDSALQIRAVVGTSVACDNGAGQVVIAAPDDTAGLTALATAVKAGDTLWWRAMDRGSWLARRVTDAAVGAGPCGAGSPGPLLRLTLAAVDTVPRGAPVRVTRQTRLSIYKAGDGSWQLGVSEWSDVLHAFAPPQPVAGPFARVAAVGARTGFRYFDATGAELAAVTQSVSSASVARVRVTVVSLAEGAGGASMVERDSVDVALAHAP